MNLELNLVNYQRLSLAPFNKLILSISFSLESRFLNTILHWKNIFLYRLGRVFLAFAVLLLLSVFSMYVFTKNNNSIYVLILVV